MKTIFRKVAVKERLPKQDGDYFVYSKIDEDDELVSAIHFSVLVIEEWKKEVVYWLEEIELPSADRIEPIIRELALDDSNYEKAQRISKWIQDFVLAVLPKETKTNDH